MNLCSDGHDEVCYEGSYCPACNQKEEKDTAQLEVSKLESTIKNLEKQIDQLNESATE